MVATSRILSKKTLFIFLLLVNFATLLFPVRKHLASSF